MRAIFSRRVIKLFQNTHKKTWEFRSWTRDAIEVLREPCKLFAVASPVWVTLGIGVTWLLIALLFPPLDVSAAGGLLVGMVVVAEALLPLTKLDKSRDYVNRKPIIDLLGYTIPLKDLAKMEFEKHQPIRSDDTFEVIAFEITENWDSGTTYRRVSNAVSYWIAVCAFVGTFTWAYSDGGFSFLLSVVVLLVLFSDD
jgi:hypothetical protein